MALPELPERPDASSLRDVRELATGVGLGAGLLAATVLTMRPLLFGFQDPSASNALVTAVVLLLSCTVVVKSLLESSLNLPPPRVTVPLGFVLFLGLLTSAFAANTWAAEKVLLAWATHALVLLAVFALAARGPIGSDGVRRAVTAAVLATAALVAMYGIWQRLVGLDLMRETLRGTAAGQHILAIPGAHGRAKANEIFSTFVYPNALAGYLGLVLPLAAGFGLAARAAHEMVAGVLAWGLAALLGIALVLTGSVGGWVAAAAGLAVFGAVLEGDRALAWVRARLPESVRVRRAVIGGGAAVVAVLVVVAVVLFMRTGSMKYRVQYWRAGTSMLAANPMGVGLGNFADRYTRFKTPAGTEVRESHNVYLGLALGAGPMALVAFGFLVFAFARSRLRGRGDPDDEGGAGPAGPAPSWLEGLSPWRTLALVGGLSGALAAFVASAATEAGVSASSIALLLGGETDSRTALTAVVHLAFFPAWGALFWFFYRVDPTSRAVRAGVLGGVAAILVHGLVDFTFSVKATMLTAAALGGLLLAGGRRTKVSMRGGAGLAIGLVVAAGLGLVFWRGSKRTLDLWGNAVVAQSEDDHAAELESLYTEAIAFSYQRNPDADAAVPVLERARELEFHAAAAEAAGAVASGKRQRVSSAFRRLAEEARAQLERSLKKSWNFRKAYLEIEPGDEEQVKGLAGTSAVLERIAPDPDMDRDVERAFEEFTNRASESYVGWVLRGHFQRHHGHMPRAAGFYEEAVARYPLNPELWLFLGDARAFFDPKLAREAYARALEVNRVIEDYNTVLFAKTWRSPPVRPASGRVLAALDHVDSELGPTPEVSFRRALVKVSVGGFAEAAAEFGKALELAPGDVQLALFRALALEMEASHLEAAAERSGAPEATGAADRANAVAHEALKRAKALQETAGQGGRIPESVMHLVEARLRTVRAVAARRH